MMNVVASEVGAFVHVYGHSHGGIARWSNPISRQCASKIREVWPEPVTGDPL